MLLHELNESPLTNKEAVKSYKSSKSIASLELSGDTDQIISYLKKHCSIAFHTAMTKTTMGSDKFPLALYKGFDRYVEARLTKPYYFFDSTKMKRKSANTINMFTALTNILPSWKNWPKRDNCLVCTNNYYGAQTYGDVFVVMPFDNTPIAVGATGDIWTCFREIEGTGIPEMNRHIYDLYLEARYCLEQLDEYKTKLPASIPSNKITSSNIKTILKTIDLAIKIKGSEDLKTCLSEFWSYKEGQSFSNHLNNVLDPVKNKNRLITNMSKMTISDHWRECWFVGKCLIIDYAVFKNIIQTHR